VDDVAVRERGGNQCNVIASGAAEDQTRPAVEMMGRKGTHPTAGLASACGIGRLDAEQLLEDAAQRVAVEPS
jgi:hypothetical protein